PTSPAASARPWSASTSTTSRSRTASPSAAGRPPAASAQRRTRRIPLRYGGFSSSAVCRLADGVGDGVRVVGRAHHDEDGEDDGDDRQQDRDRAARMTDELRQDLLGEGARLLAGPRPETPVTREQLLTVGPHGERPG